MPGVKEPNIRIQKTTIRRPTEAKHADGSRYNYSVAFSKWRGGKGDVVGDFKDSCLKRGLGVGYYYSLGRRPGSAAVRPTGDEELQMMAELWTKYGNSGNLTEIWFDGGYEGDNEPSIRAMLKSMQPNAQAFNVRRCAMISSAACLPHCAMLRSGWLSSRRPVVIHVLLIVVRRAVR